LLASVGRAWEAVRQAWEEDLEDVEPAQNLEVASVEVELASVKVEVLLFG